MDKLLKYTDVPHTWNADGTRRRKPCNGHLAIHTGERGVYVCCAECGEGYRFEFVPPGMNGKPAPDWNYKAPKRMRGKT